MPITPLHLGVLAPINHLAPNKVSNVSFILVNLWIDLPFILAVLTGNALPSHDSANHSFVAAALIAVLVSVPGMRSRKWVYGAFLGSLSHIALDMLVHMDMSPLEPMAGNPFYMGWMEPLSLALLPLTVWFIFQSVSYTLDWVKRIRVPA